MRRFYIHTMGCKANQFEGAVIVENLIKNGLEQVDDVAAADIFVLNSCTVTHKSDNEAFYHLRSAKNKNPEIVNILTGCIAQVEAEKLLENEFIDYVLGNDEKLNIIEILRCAQNDRGCFVGVLKDEFQKVWLSDTNKTRASLKIQDGCDNRCSYCIIPFARGKSRSARVNDILEQIENFVQKGFKEVVLTGIHIGQWGVNEKGGLLDLLKAVERTKIPRYRLGSLNPLEITDEMLEFLSASEKFCPHFHLSLQSACNKTLQAMNRHYKVEDYLALIERINRMFALPFIGSDIIVGFAGETDEDFEITRQNLERAGLSQIHVFPYSLRKGTAGALMENQVPDSMKEQRAKIIREISAKKHKEFVEKNIGTTQEVLVEKNPKKGITRNYLTIKLTDDFPPNSLQFIEILRALPSE